MRHTDGTSCRGPLCAWKDDGGHEVMDPITETLYANLHDGQPGGVMTVSVDDHVKETVEVIVEALSALPDLDHLLDRSSSASRQHFIDTGRYLFVGEA